MTRLTGIIAATAIAVLALLALAGPAGAQATAPVPVVPTTDYVANVTTLPPDAAANDLAQGPAAAATGALPVTGDDALPLAQAGVALLVAGALVTFAVRRRNHTYLP